MYFLSILTSPGYRRVTNKEVIKNLQSSGLYRVMWYILRIEGIQTYFRHFVLRIYASLYKEKKNIALNPHCENPIQTKCLKNWWNRSNCIAIMDNNVTKTHLRSISTDSQYLIYIHNISVACTIVIKFGGQNRAETIQLTRTPRCKQERQSPPCESQPSPHLHPQPVASYPLADRQSSQPLC